MRPIYCAFYTVGTLYEQEAARLRGSLDRFGLPHDIVPVDDRGSWERNSGRTAEHILSMLDRHPDRPIVQLDADAYLHSVPTLFEEGLDCDIAVHYRKGQELLNGTVYLSPRSGARTVIQRYFDLVQSHPGHHNEQWWLGVAIGELSDLISMKPLPASYCWIHDVMKDDLNGDAPVIEHLQASRESRGTALLGNRIKRLQELG